MQAPQMKMREALAPRIFYSVPTLALSARSESEGWFYRPRLAFLAILRAFFGADFFAAFFAFFAFLAMPWLLYVTANNSAVRAHNGTRKIKRH